MISLYILIASFLIPSLTSTVYRQDYVYNRQTDAFYKLHIESRNRRDAGKVCEAEGAKLMLVETDQDVVQFHAMFKKYPDLGDFAFVQEDGKEREPPHDNVIVMGGEEDDPTRWSGDCEVLTRWAETQSSFCYQALPFICKVTARDTFYDSHCDVYGKNYKYVESTGSCYRISEIAYTWNGAYDECQAEGAHLVVLNSETEHQVRAHLVVLNSETEHQEVWNLTQVAPHADEAKYHWFLFAGFRANHPTDGTDRVFRTIFNQTLEEAGYDQWSEHEPNNAQNEEYCGSIFKNDGKLNDLDCSHVYSFICEKERHAST